MFHNYYLVRITTHGERDGKGSRSHQYPHTNYTHRSGITDMAADQCDDHQADDTNTTLEGAQGAEHGIRPQLGKIALGEGHGDGDLGAPHHALAYACTPNRDEHTLLRAPGRAC